MNDMRVAKIFALALTLGVTACEQATIPDNEWDAAFIEQGRDIAEQLCTACHSINRSGDSPRANAPPLRTVLAQYNPESLADDFREHIHVGHPDMPDFDFNVKETEAVLAYLRSIQEISNEEK